MGGCAGKEEYLAFNRDFPHNRTTTDERFDINQLNKRIPDAGTVREKANIMVSISDDKKAQKQYKSLLLELIAMIHEKKHNNEYLLKIDVTKYKSNVRSNIQKVLLSKQYKVEFNQQNDRLYLLVRWSNATL
jgi:hypothetical protein